MGRNKYTPEQALEVFRAKFAAQYPGCKAIIQAVDERKPAPIVVDATTHANIYEFVDALVNNKITPENVEQTLRWMDTARNEICDANNVYSEVGLYKKRVELFKSDKKYKAFYQIMDKVTFDIADKYPPIQIGNRINANGLTSISDGPSVCIGYVQPKKVEEPTQSEPHKRFYDHQKKATTGQWEIDRCVYSLLGVCDQLYETNSRPVKNAAEAHEAVAGVNCALSVIASDARKLAETAERLSAHK
mgnify:CR=1 FL=1